MKKLWLVVPLFLFSGPANHSRAADFNGDGFDDIAIFRQGIGLWAIRDITRVYFGTAGDIPVPGAYNQTVRDDIAIFRRSTGMWSVRNGTRAYFGGEGDWPIAESATSYTYDFGATGKIVAGTPLGAGPGWIFYAPNGHRRDLAVNDAYMELLTSPSSGSPLGGNGITITENGNVGIGTADPAQKLSVVGTGANPRLQVRSEANNSITEINLGAKDAGGTERWFNIYNDKGNYLRVYTTNSGNVFSIDQNGYLLAKKLAVDTILAGSSTHFCRTLDPVTNGWVLSGCNSAAEYVPTADRGWGYPEEGDLVSIVPEADNPSEDDHAPFVVASSTRPNDPNLFGFITSPSLGADGNQLDDHYLPLGVYGYFPVKVCLENGPIRRGDPITSSSAPGFGMKATEPGRIVGYALEDADEEGRIQLMIQPGYFPGNGAAQVVAISQSLKEKDAEMASLKERVSSLEEHLSRLESTRRAL